MIPWSLLTTHTIPKIAVQFIWYSGQPIPLYQLQYDFWVLVIFGLYNPKIPKNWFGLYNSNWGIFIIE